MPTPLTEKEFSKHVNTKFRVAIEDPLDIELTSVKGYLSKENEQSGMERFSLFFKGPESRFLSQQSYSVEHEAMGAFDLFLVPIGRDASGFNYEAVFNYFREAAAQ